MSKLINMGGNRSIFFREGLELGYTRGVGLGLAERKERASPRKGVSLSRDNKVWGAVGMHTWWVGRVNWAD